MRKRTKKVVMYIDGVKSAHKDVLKEALTEQVTLNEMKKQLAVLPLRTHAEARSYFLYGFTANLCELIEELTERSIDA